MKTADFIREHDACREGADWALSISDDMADVWEAMIEQNRHEWLLWTATRPVLFPDSAMRELACRFVRETPIGRETVWDKLTDGRSRVAVCVAEAYADGDATDAELSDAYAAARDAADAAYGTAYDAAYAERVVYFAAVAASDAAYSAAYAADSTRSAADAAAAAAVWAVDAAVFFSADATESACAAAKSAQVRMVAGLGNPFKKESSMGEPKYTRNMRYYGGNAAAVFAACTGCAHFPDFDNVQESDCAFGGTDIEVVANPALAMRDAVSAGSPCLIAAAPDLLAALEDAKKFIEDHLPFGRYCTVEEYKSRVNRVMTPIEAAISKAKGD